MEAWGSRLQQRRMASRCHHGVTYKQQGLARPTERRLAPPLPYPSLTRAAPPRQRNVRRAERVGAGPAVGLELERWRRVDPRDGGAEDREEGEHRPIVFSPPIELEGKREAAHEQRADLEVHLVLRDCAGRDGAVGLVDSVQVTVEPVVARLCEAAQQRPRQHHGAKCLEGVLGDDTPAVGGGRLRAETRCVLLCRVAKGARATTRVRCARRHGWLAGSSVAATSATVSEHIAKEVPDRVVIAGGGGACARRRLGLISNGRRRVGALK